MLSTNSLKKKLSYYIMIDCYFELYFIKKKLRKMRRKRGYTDKISAGCDKQLQLKRIRRCVMLTTESDFFYDLLMQLSALNLSLERALLLVSLLHSWSLFSPPSVNIHTLKHHSTIHQNINQFSHVHNQQLKYLETSYWSIHNRNWNWNWNDWT